MASVAESLIQTLCCYTKKPWEITRPAFSPEYCLAIPKAMDHHAHVSLPKSVFDIKYLAQDQFCNRHPIKCAILKKVDLEKMMKENTFDLSDFLMLYLNTKVVENNNAVSGNKLLGL
ncbi:hypothetical protein CDL12_10813 [Handroanthus impetiginosus]|uniref:Uncharacterized protein n=1 Tax=Handroanthus impetiginosus TaxID=429701 RepID=A0A2G9HG81_9LAMI|nr:hypothetical protein CDL12_10814 [Handroanthus impetiginosus]PIN16536.1 hypothetical protein CDL12_10813 [Handroanthus impetiginosus]